MSSRVSGVVLAAAITLASGPLAAESFRNPPSRPLLVMRSFSTVETILFGLPPDPRVLVSTLFIFSDRTLIKTTNNSPEPIGVNPHVATYTRGRVPAAAWNALMAMMASSGVDNHDSCRLFRPAGPYGSVSETVINWYGRQGRTNTFSLTLGEGDVWCEDFLEMYDLLSAIREAALKVEAAAASERFTLP